jgi:hypothetical protein
MHFFLPHQKEYQSISTTKHRIHAEQQIALTDPQPPRTDATHGIPVTIN